MIRFRFTEDEKRYLALLSEVYRIAASSLNHQQMSVVMRNLGKIQDILLLEGVRQGTAAAAISEMKFHTDHDSEGTYEMMPFQLHAAIYGANDTPLYEVEREWLEHLPIDEDSGIGWLDPEPMQFAPDTEKAALQAARKATPTEETPVQRSKTAWDNWDDDDVKKEVGDNDLDIDAILAENEDDDTFESPQSLDRIRDVLMTMAKSKSRPGSWQEMVLAVHRATHIDAGFIDMQLGTAMGRNVLAQAGMADLHPGPMGLNMTELLGETSEVTPLSAEQVAERLRAEGSPVPPPPETEQGDGSAS